MKFILLYFYLIGCGWPKNGQCGEFWRKPMSSSGRLLADMMVMLISLLFLIYSYILFYSTLRLILRSRTASALASGNPVCVFVRGLVWCYVTLFAVAIIGDVGRGAAAAVLRRALPLRGSALCHVVTVRAHRESGGRGQQRHDWWESGFHT